MLSRSASDGVIDVQGLKLPLQAAGEGKPVVHLRNGNAAPETVSLLAQQGRVLAIDVGGAKEPGEAFGRALAEALVGLGVEKFSIVAQGSCAGLALWLGLARPDAVEGIVLVAPTLMSAAGEFTDPQLAARVPESKAAVLALFGTRDAASPPKLGHLYRQKIPSSHLVFVYDAGHDIEAERPAATAAVMRDFLDRREQFIVNAQNGKIFP